MEPTKPAPSGSCSDDLSQAKTLTRRLRLGDQGHAPGSAPVGYVSFGQRAPTAAPQPQSPAVTRPSPAPVAAPAGPTHAPPAVPRPRPSTPLMPRRELLRAPVAGFGPEAWNKLLDACVAAVSAEAAFLMDGQGLVVAARGSKVGEELAAVGARLMVAFDQGDHIEGKRSTLAMAVETSRGTLQGIRLAQADGTLLMLGLVVPGGLSAERQARVVSLVVAAGSPPERPLPPPSP
jgi:hypothetical protein